MIHIFLAGVLDDNAMPGLGPFTPAMKERLIVLGSLALVLIVIVAWALAFRHHRRRLARREEHRRRRQSFRKNAARSVAELREYVQKRRRRRRREHRPRNPTLAETGGLPPARGEGNPSAPTQPH